MRNHVCLRAHGHEALGCPRSGKRIGSKRRQPYEKQKKGTILYIFTGIVVKAVRLTTLIDEGKKHAETEKKWFYFIPRFCMFFSLVKVQEKK